MPTAPLSLLVRAVDLERMGTVLNQWNVPMEWKFFSAEIIFSTVGIFNCPFLGGIYNYVYELPFYINTILHHVFPKIRATSARGRPLFQKGTKWSYRGDSVSLVRLHPSDWITSMVHIPQQDSNPKLAPIPHRARRGSRCRELPAGPLHGS